MSCLNNNTIYIGFTNNIERRVKEHKDKVNQRAFSSYYNCVKLVWYEEHFNPDEAIAREKLIKRWKREWKNQLIAEENPQWKDLAWDWHEA